MRPRYREADAGISEMIIEKRYTVIMISHRNGDLKGRRIRVRCAGFEGCEVLLLLFLGGFISAVLTMCLVQVRLIFSRDWLMFRCGVNLILIA